MRLLTDIQNAINFVKAPSNAVFLIAWGSILLGYWRGVNNHLPILRDYTDVLEYIIVLIPILFSVKFFLKVLKCSDILFVGSCVVIYILNSVIYLPNFEHMDKRCLSFIFLVLPYYIIGVSVDLKKFIYPFYVISVISILVATFYNLIYTHSESYVGDVDTSKYDMNQAYLLLPHVLLVSWYALRTFHPGRVTVMIIGIMMIFSYGTRGPLLCLISFITLYLLFFKKTRYRRLLQILSVSTSLFIIKYIDAIALGLQVLIGYIGMSSRIIDYFQTNKIDISNGRDYIAHTLIDEMNLNTDFFGHGLLGSYRFVNTYPHNLFLEFLFSFGPFLGIILILAIFWLIGYSFYLLRHSQYQVFLLLLFCSTIIKLMLSSTFLDDSLFFMLLGFCVQTVRNKTMLYQEYR